MKNVLAALLVAGVVSVAGVSDARAQTTAPVIVKAPFQFIAGGTVFPAGTYRVTAQSEDGSVLMISSVDGKAMAAFAATVSGNESSFANGISVNVSFKKIDGHYFLAQIAVPGEDARVVTLSHASAEQVLARLNLGRPIDQAAGSRQ